MENNEARSAFYSSLKRNMVSFFKPQHVAVTTKEKTLRNDCQLFSRLFISCQNRKCNLEEFFSHENQSTPASLSDDGRLHITQKSQLIEIRQMQTNMPETEPHADALIDGSCQRSSILPLPELPKLFKNMRRKTSFQNLDRTRQNTVALT